MTYTPEQLRKLDALVAEKVMEISYHRPSGCCTSKYQYCKKYTTDNKAAMEVLEKYPRFTLSKSEMPKRYYCDIVFHMGMGDFKEFKAEATTVPLAICLAALKVAGVDVDSILH